MKIESAEVTLTAADPRFADLFYEWRQDPLARRLNPLDSLTVEQLGLRLSSSSSDLSEFESVTSFFWFISQSDEKIGWVSLSNINKRMLTIELGYGVSPMFRSQGIASRAVALISKSIFEKTPVRKIIAYVHEKNAPSIRLLGRIGFRQEGLLREHYLIDGAPASQVIFGLLKSDENP